METERFYTMINDDTGNPVFSPEMLDKVPNRYANGYDGENPFPFPGLEKSGATREKRAEIRISFSADSLRGKANREKYGPRKEA